MGTRCTGPGGIPAYPISLRLSPVNSCPLPWLHCYQGYNMWLIGDGTLRLWDVLSPGGECGCVNVGGVEILSCSWNKYNEVREERKRGREGKRGGRKQGEGKG